jgi:hypothetical protein
MAKVHLNNMIIDIQGRMGDFVFKKSPTGEIIISQIPDMSNVKWSKAQEATRERMTEANAYAQEAMNDPEMRAYYEEKARRQNKKSPYRMAVSDYFKVPERVEEIQVLRRPYRLSHT